MSDKPFEPTGALLAAAMDPKTHNQAYEIWKGIDGNIQKLRKQTTVEKEIQAAKDAGFVIGARVARPMGGKEPTEDNIGEVVGYNDRDWGMYNGFENPVRVKFPNTTDVYPYKNYLVLVDKPK